MTRKTIPNSQSAISNQQSAIRSGSAIILAIVLTTLLAILGALFLLSSRVDSVATSAVGDNQDLKLAVDTVVAQISEAISSDVPRTDANGVPLEEYYDYPDDFNPWLASLEPNAAMLWPHITDLYYKFGVLAYNIPVNSSSAIIPEYQPTVGFGLFADADGDGVTDSRWAPILDKTSAKGKPIYAAIRIIDNGGMLNINTGYKFDPCGPIGSIDGSSQTQINFLALSALDNTHVLPGEKQDRLLAYRSGSEFNDIGLYEQKVVWQYGLPAGAYTPFDISDELNLRNRYIINRSRTTHTISRIETLWTHAFDGQPYVPRDTTIKDANWTWVTYNYYPFPCPDPCTYDNRHVATTYNCDRIINPAGQKMLNINSPLTFNKNLIYNAVREALDPCVVSSADIAQITANLMDYIDGTNYPPVGDPRYDPNNEVTEVNDPSTGTPRYGFETPCVYISEIAQNFYKPDPNSPGYDANDPNRVYRSYAIELFKPYWQDDEPNGWKLQVKNNIDNSFVEYDVNWTGSRRFHVIWSTDAGAIPFNIDLNEVPGPNDFNAFDPNNFNHLPQIADINFTGDKTI
ncbi:MAG: hypothetical protein IMZ61_08810, partial [Planctomycetes bacterium]|nr:hypothetical protein [Planctomycetota bacterium]